jgi:hypothetical protein
MRFIVCACALVVVTIFCPSSVRAAGHPDCSAPVFRQFDFWAGNWEVFDTAGALQGHNRVTREDRAGVMRMTGHHPTAKGRDAIERTTWTREGSAVRQVWDFSIDGGRTWKKHFEGIYRPHAG